MYRSGRTEVVRPMYRNGHVPNWSYPETNDARLWSLTSDFAYSTIDVIVPWSVLFVRSGRLSLCHVRALCLNGRECRQAFFSHKTAPCLSETVFKFYAYIGRPIRPQFLPQSDPLPVDLSVGNIRRQNAAEWLEIGKLSRWKAYRKPAIRIVPSLTPLRSPLSPKSGSKCTHQYQLRDACCHLVNMMEDIDKLCAAPGVIMSRAMSSFAKLLC